VLLDALAAHEQAIVIAGAQAIYLQTGAADLDLAISPYTTDGDLVVNPSLLGDDPRLEAAGFHLSPQDCGHIEPESGSLPQSSPAQTCSSRST
jgi:hypothetical protein